MPNLSQNEGQKSIEFLVEQLGRVEQTLLPLLLQEIRGIGLAHHHLLQLVIRDVDKLAASCSSAVRLLVQQIREDYKK